MKLYFLDPQRLRSTEEYDADAAFALSQAIKADGYWREPLLVHTGCLALLDGHHRRVVALALGLSVVPCLVVSYCDDSIELGTRRDGFRITSDIVLAAAETGRLLPHKTTWHRLRHPPVNFAIPLELLESPMIAVAAE
jgi:hypothetical protein